MSTFSCFIRTFLFIAFFSLVNSLQAQMLVQRFDTLSALQNFAGSPPNLGQVDRINLKQDAGDPAIFSLGEDPEGGQQLDIYKNGRKMRHFDRETGIEDEPFLRISFDFALESSVLAGKLATFIIGDSLTPNSQIPGKDERWGQIGIYVEEDSFYITNEIINNRVIHRSKSYGERKRISIFLSSSTEVVQYIAPDESEATLLPLHIDAWLGEELAFSSPAYGGISAEINMVKFLLWLNDVKASASLDNLVITDQLSEDPLPVELLNFTAKKKQDEVRLSWQTAWEFNSSHFEVERSLDGTNFNYIGRVEAAGESNELENYQFNDAEGAGFTASMLYYRLRQVDVDGAYTYSLIQRLQLSLQSLEGINVGPNPFTDHFNMSLPSSLTSMQLLELRLLDSQGKIVLEEQFSVEEIAGQESFFLAGAAHLKAGLYLLEIRTSEGRQLIRLTKQ